jgi:hypothetical protein
MFRIEKPANGDVPEWLITYFPLNLPFWAHSDSIFYILGALASLYRASPTYIHINEIQVMYCLASYVKKNAS